MSKYNLQYEHELKIFLNNNPEKLNLDELSIIAELSNNNRSDTAAYYTDKKTLDTLYNQLPELEKDIIHILEPSVGIGNFLDIIIKKYKHKSQVIIDLIDIDKNSLQILKILNKYRNIPENIQLRYIEDDFLNYKINHRYDIVIGNPPFLKKNKISNWGDLANKFDDYTTTNISSFFLQKSLQIADNVLIIMPKYFLSNRDFELVRKFTSKFAIKKIIDFGENGFEEVLIETIALIINTKDIPYKTECISITKGLSNKQLQSKMTDEKLPNWLLYRNEFFDSIVDNMKLSIFKVVRDRAITNKLLDNDGVRVLKSRNMSRDGKHIIDIENYDAYIKESDLVSLPINKYRYDDTVYMVPNMTYYPRVIRKPYNCVTNGSIALLINNTDFSIMQKHIDFWNSKNFTEFYAIARNYSTRSLNIDVNSVQYFGLYEGE